MAGKLVKLLSDLKEEESLKFVEKSMADGTSSNDLLDDAKDLQGCG